MGLDASHIAKGDAMSTEANLTRQFEAERYVFAAKPRCPLCECIDLQTLRSQKNGDGTITQRKRCRSCDHRFSVVWE